jgi:hypothetical protein
MTSNNDLVQVGCVLTREQHAQLKELSRRTHISITIYLRQAVDKMLAEQRRKNRDRPEELP